MPQRKIKFVEGKYYHVFNRGTDKRKIFMNKGDLYYFLDSLVIANSVTASLDRRPGGRKRTKQIVKEKQQPLVSIVAYSLMSNHFHLVITPLVENGVSKFMQRFGTSYTKFFNKKYDRLGVLFQGRYKAVCLSSERSLELLSVYVNLNYKYHKIDPKKFLVKTSLFEYFGIERGEYICDSKIISNIVSNLGGVNNYKKYLKRQSEYFASKKNFDVQDLSFEELEDL